MVSLGSSYQKVDPTPVTRSWNWDLEKKPAFILILSGLLGLAMGWGLDQWIPNVKVYPWLYLGWAGISVVSGLFLWFSTRIRVYQRQLSATLLVLGYLALILIGFLNNLPLAAVALLAAAQLLMALSFSHWVEYTLFAILSLGVFLFCMLSLPRLLIETHLFMGLMVSSTLAGGLFTWWRSGRLDPETPADQLISHLMDQDEDALFLLNYDGERIVFQNYAATQLLMRLGIPTEVDGGDLLQQFDISTTYLLEHMSATAPSHPEKQYFQMSDARGGDLRLELTLSKLPLPEMPYFRLKISDITQRVEREHNIRRSLAIHQSLMHAMPDLIISVDSQDRILTLHSPRRMRERVRLNTFEGQPLQRLIHTFLGEEAQQKVAEMIDQAREGGQLQQMELQFDFESETLHFELRLMRMQTGDELLGLLRDITQSRQTALALQRSESNYQEVFNSGTAGMMILDQETFRPIDVNSRAALLLGYQSEALLDSSLLDLIDAGDFSAFTSYLEAALDREPQHFDTRLITHGGRPIEVEMHIKHAQLDGVERLMVIFDDIADQIQRRRALAESEQRYRALVQNMNEGLILTDEQENILYVNPSMQEVLGLSEAEILGRSTYDLLGQGEYDELIRAKTIQRQNGTVDDYELAFERKDGRKVWLLISGAPYTDHQGRVIGTIATITDITKRKYTELKLEEKKNELDSFIYKASHDLRGPLASIIGVANLAKNELGDEAAIRYLELIGRSTKKLDLILGELLDATRINHVPVQPEAVDLPSLIDDTFAGLEQLLTQTKVKLSHQVPVGLRFYTDSTLLQSALQNLVVNGITYANPTRSNSFVRVIVKPKAGGAIQIEVQDNGIGIAERIQPKVFEMFYRGHNQSKGSGLGLYIVKTAVDKLGGEVKFESEVGKGSSFFLELVPMEQPALVPQES